MIPIVAVVAVTALTILVGAYGVRVARTTSDFFVASRTVPPFWNASAISGEYISAASFLGVAGLVLKYGVDMLWFPVGYAAGYLVLLLFVAAPLRRFGAYTIPDFAEGRLDSTTLRRVATGVVLVIGWFYLLPQMKGAGVTLNVLAGAPSWVGPVVVGGVVTLNVALGGMRGITFVQAFQFWIKVAAIAVPALVLIGATRADGDVVWRDGRPTFDERTTVNLKRTAVRVDVDVPTVVDVDGRVDGIDVDGVVTLPAGRHDIGAGTKLTFAAGTPVPHQVDVPAVDGDSWERPFGAIARDHDHPLWFVYSLILATFLGTMGLPHILVRFYTNPDGRAARRTTVLVLVLLASFYVWPAVFGVLGRTHAPELYLTGRSDAVVLVLPQRVIGGLGGELLGGVVAAGAFAAFLSTSSGLLISLASALAHDVLHGSVRAFRISAFAAGVVAIALSLAVGSFDLSVLVGWAFAIAASSFCPLLVLGIWWRNLTAPGALAGLVVGAATSSGAIVASMTGAIDRGWPGALANQPAAWSVPLAFATMVLVSKLTPARVPGDVMAKMLTLHAPERLGLARRWDDPTAGERSLAGAER